MMSIQILTRNLRRVASLRGFSYATISKKPDVKENTEKKTKNSKSTAIFDKLKSLDQSTEDKIEELAPVKTQIPKIKAKLDKTINLAAQITNAETVSELLQLSEKNLNQQNAMAIVTKLSALTVSKDADVKDFERDYRFLKICKILSRLDSTNETKSIIHKEQLKSAELDMVLSIAGDDEALKIIESLSLPQKVKVFSSLARKKTRSIPVLKTLATTISSHSGQLNLKECSDLLFAMTSLNFIDEMLLSRISIDINEELRKNLDKTAVVGSIVTSMGFIKFKDPILLDNLTEWIIQRQDLFRSKDLASLVLTLALVNYRPKNVNDLKAKMLPKIIRDDLIASEWLQFVWALSVLEIHQPMHLESVLRSDFLKDLTEELGADDLLPAQKMKLLNVNAVAKYLTSNYDGPFLESESSVNNCLIAHRKSKKVLIQGLLDTLKNLFTDNSYIRTQHNAKLGFVIDAECVLNESRIPLSVETEHKDAFRIALMVLDYHDVCRGQTDPNGYNAIAFRLLEKIGYHVLQIPFNEFSTSDKLLKRVQYLDTKLKNIVKRPSKET